MLGAYCAAKARRSVTENNRNSSKKCKKIHTDTLQEGEVTGHRHRLQGDFEILSQNDQKFVNAKSQLELVHEEHNTIQIPIGMYVLVQEREFDLFDLFEREVYD